MVNFVCRQIESIVVNKNLEPAFNQFQFSLIMQLFQLTITIDCIQNYQHFNFKYLRIECQLTLLHMF